VPARQGIGTCAGWRAPPRVAGGGPQLRHRMGRACRAADVTRLIWVPDGRAGCGGIVG